MYTITLTQKSMMFRWPGKLDPKSSLHGHNLWPRRYRFPCLPSIDIMLRNLTLLTEFLLGPAFGIPGLSNCQAQILWNCGRYGYKRYGVRRWSYSELRTFATCLPSSWCLLACSFLRATSPSWPTCSRFFPASFDLEPCFRGPLNTVYPSVCISLDLLL